MVKDCDELCVFKDANNSWCFETTPPMLKIGWEWGQKFGETDETTPIKYYQVEFIPYYEAQVYVQSLFNIERLFYNEFTVDLAKFKMNYFFSAIVNGNFAVCPGIGYESDSIDFSLSTSFKFVDCYKIVIRDLCDFSTSWTGYDAKWFDECDQSSDATIDLKTWNFLEAEIDHIHAGTVAPTSVWYCTPLPGIGSAAGGDSAISAFAKMAYTSLGNYIYDNYREYL